ncbi:S9 family peptidase [Acidobacteria bacterium AH-259-O06]|nr:S9 family peptidase [Acidobacteria bacterium AH-259-O06]
MKHLRNLFFGFVIVISSSLALAQEKRAMTPIDLLDVPLLSDPQLSPDGKQLLYVLAESEWKANKRISHIWRINTDGTRLVQLTNGPDGEQSPRWSPEGKYIAFLAKRDDAKEEQIYLLSNDGGEARQLTDHAPSVSAIRWSPDGTSIYFLAPDAKTEQEKEREKSKDDVCAFDENWKHRHLWVFSVSESTERRITEGDYSVRGYHLSRDGRKIAFHRAPSPLLDDSLRGEVWVMDADGKRALQLTNNRVPERGARLSPDNSQVLFLSDSNENFDFYYNRNLFLVPASGGESRVLLKEMSHEVQQATWSSDGRSIYFIANTGVRSELFRVDVATEKLEQLTEGDHTVKGWSYVPSAKHHIFSIDEPTNAGDVWMLSTEGATSPTRITKVYSYLAREFELPRQERVQWKGEDGVTVEGLLYYPLEYQEGKSYPLIVQTHGGPRSSDKFAFGSWSRYVQVQTALGYAVFKPNYRGSTGYGDDFLRDMVGHYYRQSHLDAMTGVDYLIERGIVDGDRMVKMGWSGGGHMTNKIITHTDRFKAASSGAGAVNWISMYGQSDTRVQRTSWFGGTPWQEEAPTDLYWEHSPLKDIHKVKTPTIVLVGETDERVPAPQSVELYRALKSNGVPSHLYIAPREPHGWRELRHQLFKINVELDWFEKHAMGREYIWAKPPVEEQKAEAKPTKP